MCILYIVALHMTAINLHTNSRGKMHSVLVRRVYTFRLYISPAIVRLVHSLWHGAMRFEKTTSDATCRRAMPIKSNPGCCVWYIAHSIHICASISSYRNICIIWCTMCIASVRLIKICTSKQFWFKTNHTSTIHSSCSTTHTTTHIHKLWLSCDHIVTHSMTLLVTVVAVVSCCALMRELLYL